jgi:hypothetical protein
VTTRRRISTAAAVTSLTTVFFLGMLPRNWIELWFRSDPDHGNGSLEYALLCIPMAIAFGAVILLVRRQFRPFRGISTPMHSL